MFWKDTKNMAMKKFINDPLDLTPELLEGLEIAHGDKVVIQSFRRNIYLSRRCYR